MCWSLDFLRSIYIHVHVVTEQIRINQTCAHIGSGCVCVCVWGGGVRLVGGGQGECE